MISIERSPGTIIPVPFERHDIDTLFFPSQGASEHSDHGALVLRLHGILGNLLDNTEHFLPRALQRRGYPSMSMNTLLANLGVFYGFGVFDDAMQQIEAVCLYLKKAGFHRVVLAGHGLGGLLALRYASLKNQLDEPGAVCGVVAIATPYSLPDTIRRRWERFGSEPSYIEVFQRARDFMASASAVDEIVVVYRAHGPTRQPQHTEVYTLKTWWHLAGPEAVGPQAHRHVGRIRVPVLFVHARGDEVVERQEAENLGDLARRAGNDDVTDVVLEANHVFEGKHEELAGTMVQWLRHRYE